ncbi:MAG: NADH-quinone oxidoreductase subunit C [Chitinophagaceae bacterium]|nr:NADH-quinone oxidoreductase subunit C [Chitinophagaceae bacterium]
MVLSNEIIQNNLIEKFGDQVLNFSTASGILSFESSKEINLKILQYLYEEPSLGFTFLTDLCGVNYPDNIGAELVVVYHLHNFSENIRLRYSVTTSIDETAVFTASKLFESANWMERETYDFFGVNFIGHPNLKRILNVDEMDYFPLRKEYPLEDQTRIDKDDEMFGRG